MTTALETEFVTATIDPAIRLIQLRWKGFAPTPEFRRTLDEALQSVLEHKLLYWLADLRGMSAILRRDEQWSSTDWFPRAAASGLKKMAIVTSTDLFNQMSVERIMDDAAGVITFQTAYFDDADVARAWLLG